MIIIRLTLSLIFSFLMSNNVYAKHCTKGKACGNTCIARDKECHVGSSRSSPRTYSMPHRTQKRRAVSSYTSSTTYSTPRRTKKRRTVSYTPTASYCSPNSQKKSYKQEKKKISPITARGKVLKILDSDIFETNIKKRKSIILYGIDAPELDQPFGEEAKEFLTKFLYHKKIKAKIYGKNNNNIDTALVFASKKNINELMVKSGYAWVYQDACTESFCDKWIRYEEEAREQKKGLWSESGRIAPWIWK